ncbi:MAG: type III-B CRISPR module-associated protein Cmr3 [Chloroflexota bacterium]
MDSWLIIPRDPLIFRDGKPFTATPGERAKSLGFPFPSTVTGAVRTRMGTDPQKGFDASRIAELLGKTVRGPFLVELNHTGSIERRYFPAPADALLVRADDKNEFHLYALAPIKPPQDALTDLTADKPGLSLVGHVPHVKDKPYHKAPRYWDWDRMKSWLENATDNRSMDPTALGLEDLHREHRTHVSIEPGIQAAREGALFQTSGMEFTHIELNADQRIHDARPLAVALETDADLTEGVDFLGGERRVVNWQKTKNSQNALPEPKCPDVIKNNIVAARHCRLILATPAYFAKGYLPEYLESHFRARVVAVALSRYQTVSGWDYTKGKGGAPKPTRRLVPAGSVYFLDLKDTDIVRFVNDVWLESVCNDGQSRNDGFGLALLGTWDGSVHDMEVKS